MNTKQAIILWASGCLTAVLMFTMFHTILQTELVAARQTAERSQKLHEEIHANLSRLYQTARLIEQTASTSQHTAETVERLTDPIKRIQNEINQIFNFNQEDVKRHKQLIARIEALEARLDKCAK